MHSQALLTLNYVYLLVIINTRRESYSTWSVCLCFPHSATSRNQAYKQQYQRLQRDTGMKYKKGFFLKTLRSEVMASFAYRDSPRRHSSALELAFSAMEYFKVV